MIRIAEQLLNQLKVHAERVYPNECCGLLIGRLEDDGETRFITDLYPVTNSWKSTQQANRMMIDPLDYMRAERRYINDGLAVVGSYHSHPEHPAVPSRYDLDNAPWPKFSYIVVSVMDGRACEVRSWEMAEDRTRFDEELICS